MPPKKIRRDIYRLKKEISRYTNMKPQINSHQVIYQRSSLSEVKDWWYFHNEDQMVRSVIGSEFVTQYQGPTVLIWMSHLMNMDKIFIVYCFSTNLTNLNSLKQMSWMNWEIPDCIILESENANLYHITSSCLQDLERFDREYCFY